MKKVVFLCMFIFIGSYATAQQPQQTATESPATAQLTPAQLQSYQGTFQVQPNFIIQFFVSNGVLYSQATNQTAFAMTPNGQHTFVPKAFEATVSFIPDANGVFSTISLTQNGNTLKAVKLVPFSN